MFNFININVIYRFFCVLSSVILLYAGYFFHKNRYEDVKSDPQWAAKELEAELELGKTKITFYATSPYSKEVASCSFTIHVRDTIPPRVYNCPTDFNVYLKENENEKEVNFMIFSSNRGDN